jgi:hypothetical protein
MTFYRRFFNSIKLMNFDCLIWCGMDHSKKTPAKYWNLFCITISYRCGYQTVSCGTLVYGKKIIFPNWSIFVCAVKNLRSLLCSVLQAKIFVSHCLTLVSYSFQIVWFKKSWQCGSLTMCYFKSNSA